LPLGIQAIFAIYKIIGKCHVDEKCEKLHQTVQSNEVVSYRLHIVVFTRKITKLMIKNCKLSLQDCCCAMKKKLIQKSNDN